MMSDDRVLPMEGVHNFRDFGGYCVAGGGRLRRGWLWRSGQHHAATDADLARISALNLSTVFDLRTSRERAQHPCRRPMSFTAVIHVTDDPERPDGEAAPHIAAAAQVVRQSTAESTRTRLCDNYRGIAFRPELVRSMRAYLAELAQGSGASLVNCMAGKDRTGIAVALVQLAAGVHRDDVVADYLLTKTAGDPEARIAAGMATIAAVTGQIDEGVLRVLMGVEAEYLETAFAAMKEAHGSIDGYLARVLGQGAAAKARLCEALVK